MSSILKPTFRLAAAAIMVSGFTRVGGLAVDLIIQSQYGGHSQYLTMQGCVTSAPELEVQPTD